jgi:hypothetical protein
VSKADEAGSLNKFDEYKLFVEDTARFSERRQKVSSTYVAVNSIILSAVALLVKDAGLFTRWQALAVVPLLLAGIFISLHWRQLILNYKKLVGFRVRQLKAIEESKGMAGSFQMYHAEEELYPRDEQDLLHSRKGLNFSDLERWLPWVFVTLYILFLAAVVVLLFVHL